jgi:hypothetical protein
MLVVQLQEHQASKETQLAALRADLNASVTNAKLEEELQFLSLHEQVGLTQKRFLPRFCGRILRSDAKSDANRHCSANTHNMTQCF